MAKINMNLDINGTIVNIDIKIDLAQVARFVDKSTHRLANAMRKAGLNAGHAGDEYKAFVKDGSIGQILNAWLRLQAKDYAAQRAHVTW